jgi:hypothetical protein
VINTVNTYCDYFIDCDKLNVPYEFLGDKKPAQGGLDFDV